MAVTSDKLVKGRYYHEEIGAYGLNNKYDNPVDAKTCILRTCVYKVNLLANFFIHIPKHFCLNDSIIVYGSKLHKRSRCIIHHIASGVIGCGSPKPGTGENLFGPTLTKNLFSLIHCNDIVLISIVTLAHIILF